MLANDGKVLTVAIIDLGRELHLTFIRQRVQVGLTIVVRMVSIVHLVGAQSLNSRWTRRPLLLLLIRLEQRIVWAVESDATCTICSIRGKSLLAWQRQLSRELRHVHLLLSRLFNVLHG